MESKILLNSNIVWEKHPFNKDFSTSNKKIKLFCKNK